MIRKTAALLALLAGSSADAGILWAGGEDFDFPNGAPPAVATSTVYRRTGYARVAVGASDAMAKSTPFSGGPVTAAWLSARMFWPGAYTNRKTIGVGRSGTNAGLFVGTTDGLRVALYKYDGTTWTLLGAEPGLSLLTSLNRIDVQILGFGAAATVNVYANGTFAMTFTGNVAAGGITNFDSVYLAGGGLAYFSEIIVSDEDTRLFSLVTLAPNAAGDTNAWTGTYADVSETITNDASFIHSATAGQEADFHLSDLPAGQHAIKGVRLNIRAAESGTGISTIQLGVKTNGSTSCDSARPHTSAWATQELFLPQNPITFAPWQPTEINALQLCLRSAP